MFASSTSAAVLWAFSFAVLTQGKEFSFPVPTPADQQPPAFVAWSPKTTEAPRLRGRVPLPGVFPREASLPPSLCGYADADKENPVTCKDSRSSCLFNTIYRAVGCCPNMYAKATDCAQHTSCAPSTAFCDSDCQTDDLILKCSELSAPNCYTYEWPLLYKNYGCGTSSFWSSVDITYLGQTLPSSGGSTTARHTTRRTTRPTKINSSSGTRIPITTTSASRTGPTTSATTDAPSSEPSANIGATAGGSVSGVAVIVASVLGLVLFLG